MENREETTTGVEFITIPATSSMCCVDDLFLIDEWDVN